MWGSDDELPRFMHSQPSQPLKEGRGEAKENQKMKQRAECPLGDGGDAFGISEWQTDRAKIANFAAQIKLQAQSSPSSNEISK